MTLAASVGAADQQQEYEPFDAHNFDRPTTIDNPWFPLKPGTRYVWSGFTVDEEGDVESRSVVFVVTDLTKVIAGVPTVVCWDQDFVDGELEETEILFAAQDNDGTVWLMGEYPEEYDGKKFIGAPCWIHGIDNARAGILMRADPELGSPSYSQGWAPSVGFTDRGVVDQVGQKTTVPFGSFDDVLVIDESSKDEPGAHQLKFYARGVGCIRVGWRGEVADQEELQLIKVEQLSTEELAKARQEAVKLEERAYTISKNVFGRLQRTERQEEVSGGVVD